MKIDAIKFFKMLNLCIKQREKLEYRHSAIHTRGVSFSSLCRRQWEKAYTCFRIQDSYFSCLQPSKPMPLKRKIPSAGPFFSPFSRPCYMIEYSLVDFRPYLTRPLFAANLNQDQSSYISLAYFTTLGDKTRTFLWIRDTCIYYW